MVRFLEAEAETHHEVYDQDTLASGHHSCILGGPVGFRSH